jgi:hypothetical protein
VLTQQDEGDERRRKEEQRGGQAERDQGRGFQLFFSDQEPARLDLREGWEEILAATP